MLIFGPKDPKYTVTVFTDVDCAYCRKLHSQIAEYNRLGVRVRYLFYPRTGPNTVSGPRRSRCGARRIATTRSRAPSSAQELKAKACANNPVAQTYALGKDFGLQGTPAIVLADGEMLDGYLPPECWCKHLKATQYAARS